MKVRLDETLKELMTKKKIRPTDLCKSQKIPSSTLCDWMNGVIPKVTTALERTAKYFDVPLEYLLFKKKYVDKCEGCSEKHIEQNKKLFEELMNEKSKSRRK